MLHLPQKFAVEGGEETVIFHALDAHMPWNVGSLEAGELKMAWRPEQQLMLEHVHSAVAFQLPL